MNSFYVSIVFIGIMLIVISLVLVAYDRKKSFDYTGKLDEKREELTGIISDADQMIEEMNKFSDYIITQMELKNEEMSTSLKMIEEKVKQVNGGISEIDEKEIIRQDKVVNGNMIESRFNSEVFHSHEIYDKNSDSPKIEIQNFGNITGYKSQPKAKEKVVQINNKYNTVIQLAMNGLTDTEIAKSLKMGKGEVQLILEMNK
jgi:hypothetical protein